MQTGGFFVGSRTGPEGMAVGPVGMTVGMAVVGQATAGQMSAE